MKIGILGGSGLYDIENIKGLKEKRIKTPFGDPSDAYMCGKLGGVELFFLPRHARGHRILPTEINHRANICGFKMLGVERVISISAIGSLRENMRPGDVVLPDQYFDRTKQSLAHTFFGNGAVAHVTFGDPTCPEMRKTMARELKKFIKTSWDRKDVRVFNGGTYVQMEGPAFSTRAESLAYRKMGFDVIGMTSLAEAKLCREAELCYQAMALVTDYDCWRQAEESVTTEMIIQTLGANIRLAKAVLAGVIAALPARRGCECGQSMKYAIMTQRDLIPAATRKRLSPIVGKYL